MIPYYASRERLDELIDRYTTFYRNGSSYEKNIYSIKSKMDLSIIEFVLHRLPNSPKINSLITKIGLIRHGDVCSRSDFGDLLVALRRYKGYIK